MADDLQQFKRCLKRSGVIIETHVDHVGLAVRLVVAKKIAAQELRGGGGDVMGLQIAVVGQSGIAGSQGPGRLGSMRIHKCKPQAVAGRTTMLHPKPGRPCRYSQTHASGAHHDEMPGCGPLPGLPFHDLTVVEGRLWLPAQQGFGTTLIDGEELPAKQGGGLRVQLALPQKLHGTRIVDVHMTHKGCAAIAGDRSSAGEGDLAVRAVRAGHADQPLGHPHPGPQQGLPGCGITDDHDHALFARIVDEAVAGIPLDDHHGPLLVVQAEGEGPPHPAKPADHNVTAASRGKQQPETEPQQLELAAEDLCDRRDGRCNSRQRGQKSRHLKLPPQRLARCIVLHDKQLGCQVDTVEEGVLDPCRASCPVGRSLLGDGNIAEAQHESDDGCADDDQPPVVPPVPGNPRTAGLQSICARLRFDVGMIRHVSHREVSSDQSGTPARIDDKAGHPPPMSNRR